MSDAGPFARLLAIEGVTAAWILDALGTVLARAGTLAAPERVEAAVAPRIATMRELAEGGVPELRTLTMRFTGGFVFAQAAPQSTLVVLGTNDLASFGLLRGVSALVLREFASATTHAPIPDPPPSVAPPPASPPAAVPPSPKAKPVKKTRLGIWD